MHPLWLYVRWTLSLPLTMTSKLNEPVVLARSVIASMSSAVIAVFQIATTKHLIFVIVFFVFTQRGRDFG